MNKPADLALRAEANPVLPPGECERVSGYGVMGLPFVSGHVLGLRRWTASSVGAPFTSIWHRAPDGRWTFYESVTCEIACTRYFGASVQRVEEGPIDVTWVGPAKLRVRTADGSVDWGLEIGSTFVTRMMSTIGSALPLGAWRSPFVLSCMGAIAGRILGAGTVKLTGMTSNRQHFDANPLRIWFVKQSRATVEGEDLGPTGALAEQAHLADFYLPQRGIFAIGRVFVVPTETQRERDGWPRGAVRSARRQL